MRFTYSRLICINSALLLLCLVAAVAEAVEHDSDRASVWPAPTQLVDQLQQLEGTPAASWATTTQRAVNALSDVTLAGGIPENPALAKTRLQQLRRQAQSVGQVADSLQKNVALSGSPQTQSLLNQLYQVRYCLERRLAVWDSLLAVEQASSDGSVFSLASHGRLRFHALNSQWSDYFLLDDVRRQFNSLSPDSAGQKQAARRTLGRMYSPVLKPEQKDFVKRAFDPQLVSILREAASEPVNPHELLVRLEQHELAPTGATEFRLNDLYQDLVWSAEPDQQAVANAIHQHYRNANVRFSVSGELLNRLVPEMPATQEPVSDRMLGAAVSGQSLISNRLKVELLPDPNQVQLRLQALGTIRSNTVARRDGFAIQNQGLARFQVFKRLAFGRDGEDTSEWPVAYSTSDQQVVGMRSKLDGVPLVGLLARKIASQKIEDEAPRTKRLVQSKVERQASERVQAQVEESLQQMRTKLYDHVLQPLLGLGLEPEPVQMSTTQQELVMRYRLAGRDQMAASTARPAAVPTSLCSCQIHESALNNAIMRMGLNGNQFTAAELQAHLQELAGTQPSIDQQSDEPPVEAEFKFAPLDPVRIRLDDQKVVIQLNLASMKIGDGKKWQRLKVTTSYVPRVENGSIVLEQSTDGIRLKGKRLRFRDQVALRTVFEVMFKTEYRINVLTPKFQQRVGGDLDVTQLVVADGWLGLSIDDIAQALPHGPVKQAQPRYSQATKWSSTARRSRQ